MDDKQNKVTKPLYTECLKKIGCVFQQPSAKYSNSLAVANFKTRITKVLGGAQVQ